MTGATWIALALAGAGAAYVSLSGQGTVSGALAGFAVATAVIMGLGPGALAPLAVFVIGAGALTRLGRARKEAIGSAEPNRGRRDPRHVAAKLGLPALLGLAALATREHRLLDVAYVAALAGAFADTAATEVGPLGRGRALVLEGGRFRSVEHGTPGGMSAAGIGSAALGAAMVSVAAAASGLVEPAGALLAGISGWIATVVESLVAGTRLGGALGHFGRNLLLSAGAATIAITLEWGLGSN
jgi:uncharacterized protein (TIGR00297 family)